MVVRCLLLVACWLPLAGAVDATPATPAEVVAVVLDAGDADDAGRILAARYGWQPRQVAAVLALELADLAGLGAAGLDSLLTATAASGDRQLLDLARKRLTAGEGMVLPVGDDGGEHGTEAGHLRGGVVFELDQVRITAERIDFSLAPIPGGGPFLDSAELQPAADGRVVLDTRASRFESLGFRGLLEPRRVTVRRLPSQEEEGRLRFGVQLEGLDAFEGLVRDDAGDWIPVAGAGDAMALELVADVVAGRVADPRLVDLLIIGAPARLDLHRPRQGLRVRSGEIHLRFGPGGRLARIETGTDSEVEGLPPTAADLPPEDTR